MKFHNYDKTKAEPFQSVINGVQFFTVEIEKESFYLPGELNWEIGFEDFLEREKIKISRDKLKLVVDVSSVINLRKLPFKENLSIKNLWDMKGKANWINL